ncbi:MAG: SoxR reducing system RseC family protein [Spirochaetaceae bacterium]|jgi:sigma-E factor negative regulatory protein RseC|nr:SoxR reducing system RseC family protein [Spirochaetaceae bacterium]
MIGNVQNIKGKIVTIRCRESDLCFGCLNHRCKEQSRLIAAKNSKALPLVLGQIVEVKAASSVLAKQIAAALVPPVLGFIAGFTVFGLFFPEAGEAPQVFCGLAGLFAAAFIVYRIRRHFPAQDLEVSYPPQIKDPSDKEMEVKDR